jgi:hypothetical protein
MEKKEQSKGTRKSSSKKASGSKKKTEDKAEKKPRKARKANTNTGARSMKAPNGSRKGQLFRADATGDLVPTNVKRGKSKDQKELEKYLERDKKRKAREKEEAGMVEGLLIAGAGATAAALADQTGAGLALREKTGLTPGEAVGGALIAGAFKTRGKTRRRLFWGGAGMVLASTAGRAASKVKGALQVVGALTDGINDPGSADAFAGASGRLSPDAELQEAERATSF